MIKYEGICASCGRTGVPEGDQICAICKAVAELSVKPEDMQYERRARQLSKAFPPDEDEHLLAMRKWK